MKYPHDLYQRIKRINARAERDQQRINDNEPLDRRFKRFAHL